MTALDVLSWGDEPPVIVPCIWHDATATPLDNSGLDGHGDFAAVFFDGMALRMPPLSDPRAAPCLEGDRPVGACGHGHRPPVPAELALRMAHH